MFVSITTEGPDPGGYTYEIIDAIRDMPKDKAPGVDGFLIEFFTKNWATVEDDVLVAVQKFFQSGSSLHTINTTAITLISKISAPTKVKDYRPISCCSTLYKIISKVLTRRLKPIISTLVGRSQSAFIEGRSIVDNILFSHEIFKVYNRKGVSPRCVLKVDLRKAYDTLDWRFLKQLLIDLGFPTKFIHWIMMCVSIVSYSLMINKGVTKPFKAKRGIRQGDPMSPYLFVLAMEYLGRELCQLQENRDFNFHPRCRQLESIHICFADDLLMYCRADLISLKLLNNAFNRFLKVTDLQANLDKSFLYVAGVPEHTKQSLLMELGFVEGSLPFRYLGVPLASRKLNVTH